MSLTFYDSVGKPYAYSEDGETIYTFTGRPIAYFSDDSIYAFTGKHLGYFNNGIFRDHNGDALLFTDGASGGPMKPMKQMKPMKSMKQMKPMKGMKQMKPMRAIKSLSWSQYNPEQFFGA
ncbi:4-fold beta flower protein [Vibrio cholerae]|uniref:4-fold beta flower protein n=1 Tax=Vibrio cholerae TaxID=666 RepID=UPI0011DC6B97|nr:hypothetical protein [Vibrio cholerae]TXY26526.1 hypothetical protein FXE90_03835 [Vibrio cholerae]GHX85564.1 hypothetical protein VCSRO110_3302 [Vibrio cholerae]